MRILLIASIALLSLPLAAQRQGIKAKVEWLSGNQMPGPERVTTSPQNIQRELLIYEAVTLQQAKVDGVFFSDITTRLVKKVKTNKKGCSKVKLPPGNYSIFVQEKRGLFANRFDGQGRINCVTVKPGEFTEITILVDYEAAY
jgi:hypothetical protein